MLPASVAEQTRSTLLAYLRTTFGFRDAALERALFAFLSDPATGLFRGPFLDLRLPFRPAEGADVPLDIAPSFTPYAHQLRAFERLSSQPGRTPAPTLVTTGTGSGKTECFLYPILDHCFRYKGDKGIKAILLYPMNALATDQARRIAKQLASDPRLEGISAGLYVGGKGQHAIATDQDLVDQREVLRRSPPDILLTNYRMLDLLLMRPADNPLWRFNQPTVLRYLVLDELHSYDGAQGSDVACLIRRLKDRLQTPRGHLVCVGTSATIGSAGTREPRQLLASFASGVFGEPIGPDAIVTEDRLSAWEAFPDQATFFEDPFDQAASDPESLDPSGYADPASYLDAQAHLWLGQDARDRVGLGETLGRHAFLRELFAALEGKDRTGGPRDWLQVADAIAASDPAFAALDRDLQWRCLASFLALVAHARREGARPFLPLQVQLWVRELRNLLRKVEPEAFHFAWRHELREVEGEHYLPMVVCRDCGIDGFAALAVEGKERLSDATRAIGEAFLRRSQYARFVELHTSVEGELPSFLCPACLRYALGAESCSCRNPAVKTIPAASHFQLSEQKRWLNVCPRCGSEDALPILGSRAASLSSVAVSHLFLSPFGGDDASPGSTTSTSTGVGTSTGEQRKMLAFTDSVQDASHRAGFFAGRTYRFNVRTGIQTAVELSDEDIPLPDMAGRMLRYWEDQLGESRTMATFLPPDLRELPEYARYKEKDKASKNVRERMQRALAQRVDWEVVREYGMGVVVGRSLDRTGCSTLVVDESLLGQAADKLLLYLEEEQPVTLLGDCDRPIVQHFLDGIVLRLRLRGGILHPLLDRYVKRGERFELSKRRNPLMSPFGPRSVLPRFLFDGEQHRTFDALYGSPSQPTWLRDWTARSLHVKVQDGGVNSVLGAAMRYLEQEGVIAWAPSGRSRAAGLRTEVLRATRHIAEVHCQDCNARHTLHVDAAARWDNQKCTHYRCRGFFEQRPIQDDSHDYYRTLHRSRRVRRIFAAEHTGMLKRQEREELEKRFKEASAPDAPNLLTCTPTLEMGIDIGDLSSVMLCSVPPMASNYLQRVGRAGRAHGNAFVVTVALSRPHDQYFLETPLEMMRGEISPPGCFLDAPEMLLRQMTAHAMDQWAKEQERGNVIPHQMRLLSLAENRDGFPQSFYRFYDANRDAITERFFATFGDTLSESNRTRLATEAREGKLTARIQAAFQAVADERKRLAGRIKDLEERKKALEADPTIAVADPERPDQTVDEASDEELASLEDAIRGYGRLLGNLLDKHPLNVLTDDGVLPNYAFPEPGVTLKSVLRRPRPGKHKQAPTPKDGSSESTGDKTSGAYEKMRFEYVRPASAALKEFAPFNTFYAEGHKMQVTQIDVGTPTQPLIESWRFCPACHHSARILGEEASPGSCPACGEPSWGDQGQRQDVVHFRRAWSSMDLADAVTVDDTEERESRNYRIGELIDASNAERLGARLIDEGDVLFGYELLRDLELRQLNFGQTGDTGLPVKIGGEEVVQPGFHVCRTCGRVQDPFSKSTSLQHVPYCKTRLGKAPEKTAHVFLYRSLRSEAIRLLLPVSKHGLMRMRASVSAALQLGFRKMFGGQPTHLRITTATEPHGDDQLQFLVLYDTVPGGTGYLAELWKAGKLLDLMALSLQAMQTCSCARDPNRDGCYRCVFAYQDAWQIPNISRRDAVSLFERILAHRQAEKEQVTLPQVSVVSVLESELEARFVEALKRRALERKWSWDQVVYGGKEAWRLGVGEERWLLEPQVPVGHADGVLKPCRPDFVLHHESRDDVLPIAVFCDGLEYHAQPSNPKARIADDIDKRQALLDSGRYKTWSVTWRDIDVFTGADDRAPPTLLSDINRGILKQVGGDVAHGDLALRELDSMELLVRYLEEPDAAAWAKRTLHITLGLLRLTDGVGDQALLDAWQKLGTEPQPFPFPTQASPPGHWLGGSSDEQPFSRLMVRVRTIKLAGKDLAAQQMMLRLFDDQPARQHPDFEASWRAFLHAWNLLQFHHEHVAVVSSERLAQGDVIHPSTMPSERPPPMPQTLPAGGDEAAMAIVGEVPEAGPIVDAIVARGLPLPTVELIIEKEAGGVDVEAVLAWAEQHLAVCYRLTDRDRRRWQELGYEAFDVDETAPERIAEALSVALGRSH